VRNCALEPGRRDWERVVTQPLLIEHQDGVDWVTLNREGIRAFLEKRKPVYIRR
jgi:hypothetical protein